MVKNVKGPKLEAYVYEKIVPSGSKLGVLYGLPKIHKKDAPIRPIISSIGTYNYKLAKYLDGIIKPLLKESKYILNDTFDFVNKITMLKNTGYRMLSFDVESLFTNIPLDETIKIVVNKLFKNEKDRIDGMDKDQFTQLLIVATKNA
jgi:hypothetical protein